MLMAPFPRAAGLRRALIASLFGGAAMAIVFPQVAATQTARTIKIVVPLPPGSAGDILARLLSEHVGPRQGREL